MKKALLVVLWGPLLAAQETSGTVDSIGAETRVLPADTQLRVTIDAPVCTAQRGDSVPMVTRRAHRITPGSRVTVRATYLPLGEGRVTCETSEGRLVVEVVEVRR